MKWFRVVLLSIFLSSFCSAAIEADTLLEDKDASTRLRFGKDISITTNVAYGAHPKQTFDVYAPKKNTTLAPVIFMVHGGAWKVGDKASKSVVQNKVTHWVKKGFIVISLNYRLLPEASVLEQANDVRLALKTAQMKITPFGGDKDKFILMGHSAGAHLVSLVATSATLPILGTVSLDSAALDVESLMRHKHVRLYDEAFGSDASYWKKVSPFALIEKDAKPYLLVCSTKRKDSCSHANAFATKATSLNIPVTLLTQHVSHKGINESLGVNVLYTQAVDRFIETLLSEKGR